MMLCELLSSNFRVKFLFILKEQYKLPLVQALARDFNLLSIVGLRAVTFMEDHSSKSTFHKLCLPNINPERFSFGSEMATVGICK